MTRDLDSPEYKALRNAVFARDSYTCVLSGQKGGRLEMHHIIRVADRPDLEYNMANCVTLSKDSHDLVTGKEEQFADQFTRYIRRRMQELRKNDRARYKKSSGSTTIVGDKTKKRYRLRDPWARF